MHHPSSTPDTSDVSEVALDFKSEHKKESLAGGLLKGLSRLVSYRAAMALIGMVGLAGSNNLHEHPNLLNHGHDIVAQSSGEESMAMNLSTTLSTPLVSEGINTTTYSTSVDDSHSQHYSPFTVAA